MKTRPQIAFISNISFMLFAVALSACGDGDSKQSADPAAAVPAATEDEKALEEKAAKTPEAAQSDGFAQLSLEDKVAFIFKNQGVEVELPYKYQEMKDADLASLHSSLNLIDRLRDSIVSLRPKIRRIEISRGYWITEKDGLRDVFIDRTKSGDETKRYIFGVSNRELRIKKEIASDMAAFGMKFGERDQSADLDCMAKLANTIKASAAELTRLRTAGTIFPSSFSFSLGSCTSGSVSGLFAGRYLLSGPGAITSAELVNAISNGAAESAGWSALLTEAQKGISAGKTAKFDLNWMTIDESKGLRTTAAAILPELKRLIEGSESSDVIISFQKDPRDSNKTPFVVKYNYARIWIKSNASVDEIKSAMVPALMEADLNLMKANLKKVIATYNSKGISVYVYELSDVYEMAKAKAFIESNREAIEGFLKMPNGQTRPTIQLNFVRNESAKGQANLLISDEPQVWLKQLQDYYNNRAF